MAAIEAVNLTKSYDGRTRALDDLTLSVSEGAVFSLLGPNGSGKTTTVRLLNGMLVPTAGNATVFGLPIGSEVSRIHAMCGVMTETAHPYENMSADENLFFFGRMHDLPDVEIKTRADRLLDFFSLTGDLRAASGIGAGDGLFPGSEQGSQLGQRLSKVFHLEGK